MALAIVVAASLSGCATVDEATLDQTLDCANCCAVTACACGQSLPMVAGELGELCSVTAACCLASPVIAAGSAGCVLGVCTRCAEGPDQSSEEVARAEIPARTTLARRSEIDPGAPSTRPDTEMEY